MDVFNYLENHNPPSEDHIEYSGIVLNPQVDKRNNFLNKKRQFVSEYDDQIFFLSESAFSSRQHQLNAFLYLQNLLDYPK